MRLNLDESEGFLDDVYDIMVVAYCSLYEKGN